jgi:D-Tyr-tRNA(Tyr) deacylase
MKTVVQRVTRAQVRIGGEVVGKIGRGLALLVGVEKGDGEPMPMPQPARSRRCGFSRTAPRWT